MKTSPFFCRAILLVCLFSCIDLFATHSLGLPVDSLPNYVVIGAFSKQRNAIRFAAHVTNDLKLKAKFEMNAERNLYYVYSLTTTDRTEAMTEAKRLRGETELQDAWVYNGTLGKEVGQHQSSDVDPVTKQVLENITAQDDRKKEDTQLIVLRDEPAPAKHEVISQLVVSPVIEEEDNSSEKTFVFKLTRMNDKVEVPGTVDIVDPDKTKIIKTVVGNESVKIADVKNKSGEIVLMAQAFGYRKVQRTIKYKATASDSAVAIDAAGRVIVPFELDRLKKGDFAIMYNVFFFRDAAIMRPESKIEVDLLADMMRENPNCIIRLHGHTNGNHAGKIVYWGEGTKDYFSLNGSRDSYGSAKELSGARAAAIQAYLISQGVEPSRCSVKAWGGKKAIHDKLSARAAENVRVEVEIVKD